MNKTEALTSIDAARESHSVWVNFGRKLNEGIDVDTVQSPLKCTECAFGQWFYTHYNHLKHIPGFYELEKTHDNFHHAYDDLYSKSQKIHLRPKKYFWQRQKCARNMDRLNASYKNLLEQSILLLEILDEVEENIIAIKDYTFENMKLAEKNIG